MSDDMVTRTCKGAPVAETVLGGGKVTSSISFASKLSGHCRRHFSTTLDANLCCAICATRPRMRSPIWMTSSWLRVRLSRITYSRA